MSMTDLLSDCLTRIRNGQMARKGHVTVLKSKLVQDVLTVMHDQGYIRGFEVVEENGYAVIRVALSYYNSDPVIKVMNRISTPGRRVYSSIKKLSKSHGGLGIKILSTPHGVISDDQAREQNLGGEVLCEIF